MQNNRLTKNYILIIRIVLSILILVVGMYFAFTKNDFDTQYNKINTFRELEAIELKEGDVLQQKITFDVDNIHSLGIGTVNRTNDCNGRIKIEFWDDESVIWENDVNIGDVLLGSVSWFSVEQTVDSLKEYTLKLSASQLKGKLYIAGISPEQNASGIIGNAVKNDIELTKQIVTETTTRTRLDGKMRILIALWAVVIVVYILGFQKLFENHILGIITLFFTVDLLVVSIYFRFGFQFNESLNYFMFMGILGAFVMVAILYSILLLKRCEMVELYFLISSFVFGMVFSIILPPFSSPDEDFHFAEAYRLSNAIMGMPINDENGYIYMRECDIQNYERYPNNEYTIDMIKGLIRGNKDMQLSEDIISSDCNRNSFMPIIMYIPQAIGITLGRIMHFNYARVVFLGRWINLLAFIVITTFAIRLIPYGKWTFYAICQIPLLMEVVSSYSYDILILSGTFLFIAYIMKLCQQNGKITSKQMGLLVLFSVVYAPFKPVYIPLMALVFLIPDSKFSDLKYKSIVCKATIVGIAVVSFLMVHKYDIMAMGWVENDTIAIGGEVMNDKAMAFEETEYYVMEDTDPCMLPSKSFLLDNPFDMVESYMGAFLAFMDEYVLSIFGNYLGWYHIRIPIYVSILTMILLYLSFTEDDGGAISLIGYKGRLWTTFLMAGSCFAIFLSMYMVNTMPSKKTIIGVQGRYMIPILIVLPLFLQGKQNMEKDKKTSIVMIALMVQILAILSVCRYIWNS